MEEIALVRQFQATDELFKFNQKKGASDAHKAYCRDQFLCQPDSIKFSQFQIKKKQKQHESI